jgi:hypothetical protein
MPFGPTSVAADLGDRSDRQPCRCIPVGLDHRDDYEEGLSVWRSSSPVAPIWLGSAHFERASLSVATAFPPDCDLA